ncbi:MAG: response regulator [Sulfuricurvum sp.]|uniref:response regulator n=1 Tax=Sulfuricurvum sp. TaxID=2025608 RepID=UPI00260A9126|nr:response regulator [Sulfuricurvum sp.]MDD2829870.1 response regulator [Sulfuricurvum sp.]MDD4949217.1 response regulator [Sulfuricurvum sp.]
MTAIIEELRTLGQDIKILYVEDNKGLRESILNLLTKFSPNIYHAETGDSGYEYYCKYSPDIVLTDIKMPGISGLEFAKKVKDDDNNVRVIFLSAFDDKEYLHEAINIGAFRYLSKPTKVPLLITTLHEAVLSIHKERNNRIFENQLTDIFNYQNNLIMMFKNTEPIVVNRQFLDFFGVQTLNEFTNTHNEIGELLLEHNGFLYSTPESGWFEKALKNPGKLFHTKVYNHNNKTCHLIMKLRLIPQKEGYSILSFDDISDLNLMMIFDGNAAKSDQKHHDSTAVRKLMNVIKENGSEVKLYNFYRGLTIVNNAILISMDDQQVVLKTSYSQLKAIKIAKNITITSEIFPNTVLCNTTGSVDFDKQTVTFSDMQFVNESANQRANIRLEPDTERHSVTLFLNEIKYFGKTRIVDISICSVKLELDALPAGLSVGETVNIVMVFETEKQPLNLSVTSKVYRIDNRSKSFQIVFLFELSSIYHDKLLDYIAKRQMELIREFKAI